MEPCPPTRICAAPPLGTHTDCSAAAWWAGPVGQCGANRCVMDEAPQRTDPKSGSHTVPCTEPKGEGGQSVWGQVAGSTNTRCPFFVHTTPVLSAPESCSVSFTAPYKAGSCPLGTSQILISRAVGVIHTGPEQMPHSCQGRNGEDFDAFGLCAPNLIAGSCSPSSLVWEH